MGIFESFRAIGYITSSVPFSVQKLGTETFVTVSIGKAWQIYNCAKLNLVLVGPQLPKKIRALASYRDYTFAAYGNNIAVFKRAHPVATWSAHSAKVNLLCLFGDHILSVDVDGIEQNLEPVSHIVLEGGFSPSCIMHPDTYLNKYLLPFTSLCSDKNPLSELPYNLTRISGFLREVLPTATLQTSNRRRHRRPTTPHSSTLSIKLLLAARPQPTLPSVTQATTSQQGAKDENGGAGDEMVVMRAKYKTATKDPGTPGRKRNLQSNLTIPLGDLRFESPSNQLKVINSPTRRKVNRHLLNLIQADGQGYIFEFEKFSDRDVCRDFVGNASAHESPRPNPLRLARGHAQLIH
ncbi:hypothetical protein Cgig2_023322 [Carnegiea gigantea]|uniref:WDR36/Utp21 N-terminal domain-containing protein n=1 Tax=Carnegiea gigantea TaxID=171969 RepID=A0A9Q1QC32_9CARY|nr:hypothetical protein Cgig2_023322 [Carnegiea gigantea]